MAADVCQSMGTLRMELRLALAVQLPALPVLISLSVAHVTLVNTWAMWTNATPAVLRDIIPILLVWFARFAATTVIPVAALMLAWPATPQMTIDISTILTRDAFLWKVTTKAILLLVPPALQYAVSAALKLSAVNVQTDPIIASNWPFAILHVSIHFMEIMPPGPAKPVLLAAYHALVFRSALLAPLASS